MSSLDTITSQERVEENNPLSWDAIDYSAAQNRHRRWVENADDRDKKRGRNESSLSLDIIEGDTKSRKLLEELENILEKTYTHFSRDPSQLISYKRYGQENRDFNRGGDDIDTIIDYLQKEKFPITKISTIIGEGYPLKWRQQWPASTISAFDINPLQHVAWAHTIQSGEGANKGYLVDAGVKEWMKKFLQTTQPDVLYLSNIVKFIKKNPQQLTDLADAILEELPAIIVCTNPVRSTSEDNFSKLLEEHYTVEFPGAKPNESVPINIVYIRKNLERSTQKKRTVFGEIWKKLQRR